MNAALGQAEAIVSLARQLAATLRAGTATIADARELVATIREAEGWLQSARQFLDPEHPVPPGEYAGGTF